MHGRLDVSPGSPVEIPEGTQWVQFTSPLEDWQHRQVSHWLAEHPAASLRVYGNYGGPIRDLEFLQHYPTITGFEIDSMHGHTPDMTGLRHLPSSLARLRLGVPAGDSGRELIGRCTQLVDFSIAEHGRLPPEIAGLANVRKLGIAGPVKSLEPISTLVDVEELRLGGVTVPDLTPIQQFRHLQALEIALGGIRNLHVLPSFRVLRYLELVMIRGFSDLTMLEETTSLEHIKLEAMKNVVELPDLANLIKLRELELHTMKGIQDLGPVALAPNLEIFWLTSAMHLQPDVLLPLVGHPTLREARVGFGSDRKNKRAYEILGLPRPT